MTKGPAEPGGRARRMGSTAAAALLAFTVLQIGLGVLGATPGRSLLPYAGLGLLVIAVIPACRGMEARWARLGDAPGLERQFRRECGAVWTIALGLPPLLAGIFRLIGL